MSSQTATTTATLDVIARFNEAFDRHDVDGIMAMMTADCVFDNTPAPDGQRFEGQDAVRDFWNRFFRASPQARFTIEEQWAADDRCVQLWRYDWVDRAGQPGHVRGVDLFRVRDDKVSEKLSYVKG